MESYSYLLEFGTYVCPLSLHEDKVNPMYRRSGCLVTQKQPKVYRFDDQMRRHFCESTLFFLSFRRLFKRFDCTHTDLFVRLVKKGEE